MVFVVSTKGISHRYLYIPHTVPCGGRSMTNIVVSKKKKKKDVLEIPSLIILTEIIMLFEVDL